MYVNKNIFIGTKNGLIRLENLQKLANKHKNGNFSRMVMDSLIKEYNLDPTTLAELPANKHAKKTSLK